MVLRKNSVKTSVKIFVKICPKLSLRRFAVTSCVLERWPRWEPVICLRILTSLLLRGTLLTSFTFILTCYLHLCCYAECSWYGGSEEPDTHSLGCTWKIMPSIKIDEETYEPSKENWNMKWIFTKSLKV